MISAHQCVSVGGNSLEDNTIEFEQYSRIELHTVWKNIAFPLFGNRIGALKQDFSLHIFSMTNDNNPNSIAAIQFSKYLFLFFLPMSSIRVVLLLKLHRTSKIQSSNPIEFKFAQIGEHRRLE